MGDKSPKNKEKKKKKQVTKQEQNKAKTPAGSSVSRAGVSSTPKI
jgi:hypothetical protein